MRGSIRPTGQGRWVIEGVGERGAAVLTDPLLNKGTAFSEEERRLFGLEGLLPHQVTTKARQVERAYANVTAKGPHPIDAYVAMTALQDRNETLFYQVLAAHPEELLPIIYTPTVGAAAVTFSHLFRRGRGVWITPAHRGRIDAVLGNARSRDVRLIVVTDNERILGLGDQGAGGMVIPIGKLALYTLGAGIHPAHTLPVSIDVGTDNRDLLDDELYVGWRRPRLRGVEYDELIDEFVTAVARRWPGALLQWEDFKKANAFRLLDRYRHVVASFNDDIQGTGAVVAAGLLAAGRATGARITEQRVLLVGAGAAGVGIARQLRHLFSASGVAPDAVALFDTGGLVVADRPGLETHKAAVAWSPAQAQAIGEATDLARFVAAFRPTAIVGTSGTPGLFTADMIGAMAAATERPVVMALSNPTSMTEADPADIAAWSEGRAIVATGSPFPAVEHGDRLVPVSQCNNVYVFPGVGLGTIVSGATTVTDSMFAAAADTLAALTSEDDLAAGRLYPPIRDLRSVTRQIAAAVARVAGEEGAGRRLSAVELERVLDDQIWDLEYPDLIAG